MSGLATPHDDPHSSADLEQLIAVCERFEDAWKVGRQHRIEDLQGEVHASLRPRIFGRELIALGAGVASGEGRTAGTGGISGQVSGSGGDDRRDLRRSRGRRALAVTALDQRRQARRRSMRYRVLRAWRAPDENGRNDRPSVVTSASVLCGDGRCFSDRSCHQSPEHGGTWHRGLAARSDDRHDGLARSDKLVRRSSG